MAVRRFFFFFLYVCLWKRAGGVGGGGLGGWGGGMVGPSAEDSELKGALINVSAGAEIKTLAGPQPTEPAAAGAVSFHRVASRQII